MRHLPIQHRDQLPRAVVQEVAHAVIAMDDGQLRWRRRRVAAQTTDGGAHDGLGMLLVGVDHSGPIVQLAAPTGLRRGSLGDIQDRKTFDGFAGDLAHRGEELPAHRFGVRAERVRVERAAGHATQHLAHDEERPFQFGAVDLQRQRLGRRDALAGEGADGEELHSPVGLDQAARRIAAQDQRRPRALGHGLEAIGLPARATGNARQPLHEGRLAAGPGEIGGELVGQGQAARFTWRSRTSG